MDVKVGFTVPKWLQATLLKGMQRGVEKESLRMLASGYLAQTPHPKALGSALTHPEITTDYSEALMELITPPLDSVKAMLSYLHDIHSYVYANLPEGESLWPLSMPCLLSTAEENIPLAQFGSSNIGQLKTLYRKGLGVRYSRRMQTISGVHYNISFPAELFAAWHQDLQSTQSLRAFKDDRYFALTRNIKRLAPVVIVLLGASPVVCSCFLEGRKHHLQQMGKGSLYLPNATSLRMGKLGYQNSVQQSLSVSYDSVHDYCKDISHAIHTKHDAYEALGVDDANGEPQQINANILQIENEFYAPVRPKQPTKSGESPCEALLNRGVAYVELRMIDVDPDSPIGIREEHAYFLEVLTSYALLNDSPLITDQEASQLELNQTQVVDAGQNMTALVQVDNGNLVSIGDFILHHLNAMQSVAQLLDKANGINSYSESLMVMRDRVSNPSLLPSAKLMASVKAAGCFSYFGKELGRKYTQYFTKNRLDNQKNAYFLEKSQISVAQQQQLEAQFEPSFIEYVQQYR